jgi:flavin-dependent dehydrogenase
VGFVAVGDAAMCTNPVYGLGTTAAVVSAVALADALHGADDLAAVGSAHAARVREGLEPWFDESLAQDRRRAALRQGRLDEREAQRHLAVAVAVARDPAVGQAVLRTRGLLGPVSDLDEPWLQARIDEVRRGLADDPPDFGPPRGRLLAALHATAPAR